VIFTARTLYLSDLDGTLLGSDRRVSDRSCSIINRLVSRGLCFSCATARSRFSSARVMKGLELTCPMIVYNGTFIQDHTNGKVLWGNFIRPSTAENIIRQYISLGIFPIVYSFINGIERFSYVPELSCRSLLDFAATRKGDPRLRTTDTEGLFDGDIFYITAMGKYDALRFAESRFSSLTGINTLLYKEIYSGEYWLEIMPRGADKAKAALKLKELLGCERMVCFGDGTNDIPMFRAADICLATADAEPELKAIATEVIGSNNEDAVALWLEQFAE